MISALPGSSMTVFAHGLGAAGDACYSGMVLLSCLVTVVTGVVGLTVKSKGATITSVLLAGAFGVIVVLTATTHELQEDSKSSWEVHDLAWRMVWWWAGSACVAAAAAARMVLGCGGEPDNRPVTDQPGS